MTISDSIKQRLGNWWPVMVDLVESKLWDDLYGFLKAEKSKGKVVIPVDAADVWKSLQLCDRTKVRCIILLQCPYATEKEINGKKVTIASGVPMSCERIAPYQQPSLQQWWTAIEDQYGFNPLYDQKCDISYLLTEEHVLLMNTSMTVEKDKVDSHSANWHEVMKWFCENVINKYLPGIPIVLMGTQAQKFERYLNPLSNPLKSVEHPAAASYANRDWKHENMHKWCNMIIEANNGKGSGIMWYRYKGVEYSKPPWDTTDEDSKIVSDLPYDNGVKQQGIKGGKECQK